MPIDPKEIWQQQREEQPRMSLELIHYKATQLRDRTRRELLRNAAVPFICLAISLAPIGLARSPIQLTAYLGAIIWATAGQYFLHRGMWDKGGEPLKNIDLYRQEIERRRSLFAQALQWSFGPAVLAIVAFTVPVINVARCQGVLANTLPFLLLLAVWFVAVFILRSRGGRELQQELDELKRLER